MGRLDELIATYPRSRPELPRTHAESYVEHYRSNRAGVQGLSAVVAKLEAWMHRRVARGAGCGSVLEIGAGSLNHVPYHPGVNVYDAVEPFRELWEDSPYLARVRHIYRNLAEVPSANRYSLIVSVAVLEHITELPFVLARAGLLLERDGSFRAGFPSEGGLLWGLAWRLTTGVEYRLKRGLNYRAIMRHEHVNTAAEILALIGYFYECWEVWRFPLPFSHFSFYTAIIARHPRTERCRAVLSEQEPASACHE